VTAGGGQEATVGDPVFDVPSWVPTEFRDKLNGSSTHKSATRFRPTIAGDGLAGTVVRNRRAAPTPSNPEGVHVTTIRVEAGQVGGKPVAAGSWLEVFWSPRDLREFRALHDPREGDALAIVYGGDVPSAMGGANRHTYMVGLTKSEDDEGEEWN
jgi:hypothetical protein